jgi:hypothetical protein
MALSIETRHGCYDVLPVRPFDGEVPDGATHSVYHEDGSLSGYVSADGTAWERDGSEAGRGESLEDAARIVAELDGELLGFAAE